MKIRNTLVAISAATFMLFGSFPISAVKAAPIIDELEITQESIETQDIAVSDEINTQQKSIQAQDEEIAQDTILSVETEIEQQSVQAQDEEIAQDAALSDETETIQIKDTVQSEELTDGTETEQESTKVQEEETAQDAASAEESETKQDHTEETQDEAPAFHACIKYRMGYTVIGTFTEFTPDIDRVETLYSLDGENWQIAIMNWNLSNLNSDDESVLQELQNQPCLYDAYEPLKSYIAGTIDHFYVKLRITKKNGISYETQSAMIERGGLQPIPEKTKCMARFDSTIAVREHDATAPYRYYICGRYQMTVYADATAEEISELLPDTLPVEIQLDNGPDFIAIGIVDCPVTWKPLSLPRLLAGESITIKDAAEEILVPSGTQVMTPIGVFELDEPVRLDTPPSTDEVRLVLNVSSKDKNPAEESEEEPDHKKPVGAGGNEGNIGADNKDDSTESGQRPYLPQTPDNDQEKQPSDPSVTPVIDQEEQTSDPSLAPDIDKEGQSLSNPTLLPEDDRAEQQQIPHSMNEDSAQNQQRISTFVSEDSGQEKQQKRTDTKETKTSGALDSLVVQAAEENEAVKISMEPAIDHDSPIPILLIATAVMAGVCVGATACKVTGHNLFHRIAGRIRHILHK